MSHYGENEAGENICVDKVVELSVTWTDAECAIHISNNISMILKNWAESHSDEYDQAYYSIIMTPAISACLREYNMLEKWREKRYTDERFRKASLTSWKVERDRCINILNDAFCTTDGSKIMCGKVNKAYSNLLQVYESNKSYSVFRNSMSLRKFSDLISFVNRSYTKYHYLELREKKANLEKQRVEFLQNRLFMEIYKYATNT